LASIELVNDGVVRSITLNRPEKRNALSPESIERLRAIFSEIPGPNEKVVTIRGVGPVFCAGVDLRDRNPGSEGAREIERMLDAMQTFPLPVVAIVERPAYAGGAELALHADIVVASTEASFAMPLAQIGFAPSWFLSKKIVELLGPAAARRLLMVGDPMPAQRLYDLGAIAEIAEPAEFEARVTAVVGRLCNNAPLALRAIKGTIGRLMTYRDAIPFADIDEEIGRVRVSEDAREGIAARLERRPAKFTGR
jgi:enoyl-CoA hydratase/carnithine racemase